MLKLTIAVTNVTKDIISIVIEEPITSIHGISSEIGLVGGESILKVAVSISLFIHALNTNLSFVHIMDVS